MLERAFLDYSAAKLRQYRERIAECLGRLSEEQIWAKGHPNENAIGNLVLHLSGNVRQWIVSGIGGGPDTRQRDAEFGATDSPNLLELLNAAVDDALPVIAGLTPERLAHRVRIQKYDLTVMEAVYHVVEHFSMHTGQIIFATKMLSGGDLEFYKHLAVIEHHEQTP